MWEKDTITLVANENYFEGRPYLDSVVLRHLTDKTYAWSELMQGKVSIVTDLDLCGFPPADIMSNYQSGGCQ